MEQYRRTDAPRSPQGRVTVFLGMFSRDARKDQPHRSIFSCIIVEPILPGKHTAYFVQDSAANVARPRLIFVTDGGIRTCAFLVYCVSTAL